jgi:hypothetical protein
VKITCDRVGCVVKMVTGGGTVSPAGVPGPGIIASNAPGCVITASPTPAPDTAGLPPQRRSTESRRVSTSVLPVEGNTRRVCGQKCVTDCDERCLVRRDVLPGGGTVLACTRGKSLFL